jgi:lysozyme family protein
MLGNFAACDAFTAPAEGGLSMDPTDPGNWTGGKAGVGTLAGTKYGIAASAHPSVNIAALTPAQAGAIRQAGYWTPNSCDDLAAGVDLMIYDEDVNAGDGRSAIILESVLGTEQDGKVGQNDITAAAAMDPVTLINKLEAAQAAFYKSLPLFAVDGKGWMTRLAHRTTAALTMATMAQVHSLPAAPPAPIVAPVAPAPAGWLSALAAMLGRR